METKMIFTSLKRTMAISAAITTLLLAGGCATKKHVRQQVDPVERRVTDMEAQSKKQQTALTDLERSLSSTDERVRAVDAKATAATESASQANASASRANQAAGAANNAATEAGRRADAANAKAVTVDDRLTKIAASIDDYKEFVSETVLFGFNSAKLTDEGKQTLDAIAAKVKTENYFRIEVLGFTDKIGDAAYNKALSSKRADAVTDYLTGQKIPLYKIAYRGQGELDSMAVSGTPKEVREQSRRVEVKVYVAKLN